MGRHEDQGIALVEHSLAALSEIQERIGFIAARRRLCRADSEELIGISDAAYRIQNYQQELRARLSTAHQNGRQG